MEKFPCLTSLKPKTTFFDHRKTSYIQALSKDGESTLLWIEETSFGKRAAYPCVYKNKTELFVYIVNGAELNEQILSFWETLTPEIVAEEYVVEMLPKKEFFKLFELYQEKSIES